MTSATTVPVRVRGAEARVELDADASLLEPHAQPWRVAVAAELAASRVVFATVVRRDASLAEVELPSRERVVGGVTVTRARPWLGCAEGSMHLE